MKWLAGVSLALIAFAVLAADVDTRERIIVLNTEDDGSVTASVVRLPPARPEPFLNTVCIREFGAPAIRCYAVSTETLEVRYVDLTIVQ